MAGPFWNRVVALTLFGFIRKQNLGVTTGLPAKLGFFDKCDPAGVAGRVLPTPTTSSSLPATTSSTTPRTEYTYPTDAASYDLDTLECPPTDSWGFNSYQGKGVELLGYYINQGNERMNYTFNITKGYTNREHTHGISLNPQWTWEEELPLPLTLILSNEFASAMRRVCRQNGWDFEDDKLAYFGPIKTLPPVTVTIEPEEGVFFVQIRSPCLVRIRDKSVLPVALNFQFESDLKWFKMPPVGNCQPQFGFVPILNRLTNSIKFGDNDGTTLYSEENGGDHDFNEEAFIKWTSGPPIPRVFMFAPTPTQSYEILHNLTHESPLFKRLKAAKPEITDYQDFVFQTNQFEFPLNSLVQNLTAYVHIRPGTYAHFYQKVATCGAFRVRSLSFVGRYYKVDTKKCFNPDPLNQMAPSDDDDSNDGDESDDGNEIVKVEDVGTTIANCSVCPQLDSCEMVVVVNSRRGANSGTQCSVTCEGSNRILKREDWTF